MSTWALEAESPALDSDGKIEHLREELARSEVDRLSLRQELQQKNKQLRELLHAPNENLHTRAAADQLSELKEQLANSEMKLIGSSLALDKKAAEAKYMGEFIHTLEDQLVNYQQKMFSLQEESVQLRRELAGHEARQTEIYLRLERQLDDWLNEKALLESRVGDMQGQLVLSVGAIQGVLPLALPNTAGEGFEGTNELTQESQGLVQTLLELGEAFLASKIGEDEFQELQAKLIAAKTRDYEIIRDLQLKIGELSEMGAVVAQLKAELREEKEKAREDAEDLTQEMAELRYQLMQMLDHERELRAHTEQASLRRIAELEEQLKRSRQETIAASSQIQAAQIQAERRAVEIKHLKIALEESRQKHSSLVSVKEGTEGKLKGQIEELQAQVAILEMDACKAKEENAKRILNTGSSYSTEVELDAASLEYGVSEARQLLADFKQHICLLGQEYRATQISQEERASQSTDSENHRASDIPTFRESREREELVLRAENLQAKLEELEEELQEENEEHVEVLIRYEEERSLMEADLEVAREALLAHCIDLLQTSSSSTKNFPSWTTEDINSRSVRELSQIVMESRHHPNGSLYRSQIDSLSNKFNIETQGIMVSYNGNSDERALLSLYTADMEQEISRKEVEALRQELQIAESKLLASNQRERMLEDSMKKQEGKMREQEQLLESLLEERMDTSPSADNGDVIFDQRHRRQDDEEYHALMMRNAELLNNLEVLQTMLFENQSRESEVRSQFQKSELELSIAKEEVFKSEVRLQKVSKQAMERIDAEKRKLQEAVNAHRQREWSLTKQLESLHKFEHDKMEILSLVDQLKLSCERAERERDELKAAYAELESQFSKRRSLLLGR